MAPSEKRLHYEVTDGDDVVEPGEGLTQLVLVDPGPVPSPIVGGVGREMRGRSGAGHLRPRRRRPGQEVALDEVDVGIAQNVELPSGLDPLGDHARAHLPGKGHHRSHQGPAVGILVDTPDEFAVELQVVGRELHDVAEARVAGTGIIHGETEPATEPSGQTATEVVVVLDRLLLGQLQDEPVGKVIAQSQESRVGDGRRAGIDEERRASGGAPNRATARTQAGSSRARRSNPDATSSHQSGGRCGSPDIGANAS